MFFNYRFFKETLNDPRDYGGIKGLEQVKDSLQWCESVGWGQPPGKKDTHMGPSMPFLPFLVLGDSAGRTPFLFDASAREVLVAHARHPVMSQQNIVAKS